MTSPANPARYKSHHYPGEIISHGVWLYYRFSLSYRGLSRVRVKNYTHQLMASVLPDYHNTPLIRQGIAAF